MTSKKKTTLLIVLDGFGCNKDKTANAIAAAETPNFDRYYETMPHSLIETSGEAVGLPAGQMGNSDVGHMNIGAGRIVYQDFVRISNAIKDGSFFENKAFIDVIDKAVKAGKSVHIGGMLSDGGVHSHEDQILASVDLAAKRGAKKIYLHLFLDGRDTLPISAMKNIEKAENHLKKLGIGKIVSIVGRYFAMDRDKRWERVEAAYNLLTMAEGEVAKDAKTALQKAYDKGQTDEFVEPTSIRSDDEIVFIEDGDAFLFVNFRADRARQLTSALSLKDFDKFARTKTPKLQIATLTQYELGLPVQIAFPPLDLKNTLGEFLSNLGKTQLRIAETEKYAHVTFFFSGGIEKKYNGEVRELISSPKVATYDLKPEMSAYQLTEKLVVAIKSGDYDFIVCNYANSDMVGHTGNFEAAKKAIEVLDECLGRVEDALNKVGAEALITADHGNAELMIDPETGQPQTSHTKFPVPLIYLSASPRFNKISDGRLCDIAPSVLKLMGLEIPKEMSGKNLIE